MGASVQDSTQCTHSLSYNRLNVLHLTLNCAHGRYLSYNMDVVMSGPIALSSMVLRAAQQGAGRNSCPADQVTGQQDSRGYTDR